MSDLEDEFQSLVDIGIWPSRNTFAPAEWLSNFTENEMPYARRLLNGFTYFTNDMIKSMFKSNFRAMSKNIISYPNKSLYETDKEEWSIFLDNCYILKVTGEIPSDADSGYIFTRMARDVLGIDEDRLKSVSDIPAIVRDNPKANFIFVDDFVGSGAQFCTFWQHNKFREILDDTQCTFYYIPLICTELGETNIKKYCVGVNIVPSHFLNHKYSAIRDDSYIWQGFEQGGPEFIKNASIRAGISQKNGAVAVNKNGTKDVSWEGFCHLGLTIGFEHGTPDATLPIFYFNENNWKPLIKKEAI